MPSLLSIFMASLAAARDVSISLDASDLLGTLPTIARFFGADEPNYAYSPDGETLLSELGELGPHQTYFRTHNLLTTCDPIDDVSARLKWGCTNAYTEDANGNPIYNWTIIDRIFDSYLERNVKPYAQISFTPKALASDPVEPYTFLFNETNTYNVIFTGWSHVPTSWEKYGELVYQWVKHEVDLRGEAEINSWYWEVWNEVSVTSGGLKRLADDVQAKHRLLEWHAETVFHIV
jgi:xylan 1,4-beta-xylosidase